MIIWALALLPLIFPPLGVLVLTASSRGRIYLGGRSRDLTWPALVAIVNLGICAVLMWRYGLTFGAIYDLVREHLPFAPARRAPGTWDI